MPLLCRDNQKAGENLQALSERSCRPIKATIVGF
jgi:hypothetical protein